MTTGAQHAGQSLVKPPSLFAFVPRLLDHTGKTLAAFGRLCCPVKLSMPALENHSLTSPSTHSWRRRWFGHKRYWLFQLCGFGALYATELPDVFSGKYGSSSVGKQLANEAVVELTALFFCHLLRVIILYYRQRPLRFWAFVGRMIPWWALCAIGTVATFICIQSLGTVTENNSFARPAELAVLWLFAWAFLAAWTLAYRGYLYYEESQRVRLDRANLQAAVKEAELRALRSQVNPHFLFNSLNTLRALIPHDLDLPREATALLADFLRSSLTLGQREIVTFAEEWQLAKSYLEIEQLRHEERLHVAARIDPSTKDWPIPPFLLQTLVENAVKYGISTREEGGTVEIEAQPEGRFLRLRVANPGQLGASSASTSLGLVNARARLDLLFGASASLTLSQADPDRVLAEVFLPPHPLAAFAQIKSTV